MAVGGIAKKMLGFADEIAEGFSKGIGDAGTIKRSVNRISTNMTPRQQKALKAFGNSKGNASKAIDKAVDYTVNTASKGGRVIRPKSGYTNNMVGIGNVKRVAGIQKPTMGNRIGDAVGGGIKDTYTSLKSGRTLGRSLSDAYMNGDKLRMDRVAGTFIGASTAARVATGGGLYKDRNGSTNIVGLPFI
jgi:hypothetical protein